AQGESAAAAFRLSRQSLLALLALLAGRRERDGSLRRQHQEGEGLLKVEPNRGVAVAQIADGDVLADVQREIAAALRHHHAARDRRSPYDLFIDELLDVF